MKIRNMLFLLIFQVLIGSLSSQILQQDNNLKKIKEAQIKSISFSYRSHDWSAFCTIYSNGDITGAHLSGNPPFVHEDKSKVSKKIIREIWKEALPVLKQEFDKNKQPDSTWAAYEIINIVYNDNICHIIWQTNPIMQNPSEEVLRLKEVIIKYHIGGW